MMDTEHYSYKDLHNEINLRTGGISTVLECYEDRKNPGVLKTKLSVRGKALYGELDFLFSMMREIILTTKLSDEKRMKEILAEQKSKLSMRLPAAGHSTAANRAMAGFSAMAAFQDAVGGIGYYKLVEELSEHFDEKKEELTAHLTALGKRIFRREGLMVSYTSDQKGYENLESLVEGLKKDLWSGAPRRRSRSNPLGW